MILPNNYANNYKIIEYPTKTYYLDKENKRIRGYTDGLDAIGQAVYKMLRTERYDYIIYDSNYGIELKALFGKDVYLACALLERRIKDALSADDRIVEVCDFDFTVTRNVVAVKFKVVSTLGTTEEVYELNV